jgi:hypothetical protein
MPLLDCMLTIHMDSFSPTLLISQYFTLMLLSLFRAQATSLICCWFTGITGSDWLGCKFPFRLYNSVLLHTVSSVCCLLHTSPLLGLHFDPEDGYNMFIWNVGWLYTDYTALRPRSLHSHPCESLKSNMGCLLLIYFLTLSWSIVQCVPLAGSPGKCWFTKRTKVQYICSHTCNEVRLCVLRICKKEVGNTKR